MSDWNSDDVCEWLEDLEMADYCQAFREKEVDGKQLVKLTKLDLQVQNIASVL